MMKIDASPQRPLPVSSSGAGAQQKTTTTTGKLTIDAERSTQQATEMVTTVRTTKVMVSSFLRRLYPSILLMCLSSITPWTFLHL